MHPLAQHHFISDTRACPPYDQKYKNMCIECVQFTHKCHFEASICSRKKTSDESQCLNKNYIMNY